MDGRRGVRLITVLDGRSAMKLSHKERHALAEMAKPIGQRDYSTIHWRTIHALERNGLLGLEGSDSRHVTAAGHAELTVPDVFNRLFKENAAMMKMAPKNRNLVNLRRLSGAATRKLETILRFGATALRDKILDETLNKHAEHVDAEHDAMAFEAAGALNAACEVAVKLGVAYRSALLTGFNIKDWYQACGLDENGELYDGLFDAETM
jgi:hypothetical protein